MSDEGVLHIVIRLKPKPNHELMQSRAARMLGRMNQFATPIDINTFFSYL
jgi:hypothetical protein